MTKITMDQRTLQDNTVTVQSSEVHNKMHYKTNIAKYSSISGFQTLSFQVLLLNIAHISCVVYTHTHSLVINLL